MQFLKMLIDRLLGRHKLLIAVSMDNGTFWGEALEFRPRNNKILIVIDAQTKNQHGPNVVMENLEGSPMHLPMMTEEYFNSQRKCGCKCGN